MNNHTDLLAACERLSEFCRIAMQGTPSQAPAYRDAAWANVYCGTPYTQIGDTALVAAALRAFVRADDGKEVDAAWLRAEGWWDRGEDELCSPPYPSERPEGFPAWVVIYDCNPREPYKPKWSLQFPGCQDRLGYDLPTRGHVRTLLRALGVTSETSEEKP